MEVIGVIFDGFWKKILSNVDFDEICWKISWNKILSRSNIYFIQLTLLAMTSKVMKTEKGFSLQKYFNFLSKS